MIYIQIRYDCAKPKTTATLIFRKHLFLFQQAFKQQCGLFHSSIYCHSSNKLRNNKVEPN